MKKQNKYLVGICVYNEGEKIKRVLRKFNDYSCYDVLVIDDASTDRALDIFDNEHIHIKRQEIRQGVGRGVKAIIEYAKELRYEAVFFVAGNDKDNPEDIAKLICSIEDGFDFVQGSRYLPMGEYRNMPCYRILATRFIHPVLFSFLTGRKLTDTTNGFRAICRCFFDDPRINLNQDWLQSYELEPYLLYKAIRLGYRFKEVPVSKIYPPSTEGYTKMLPFGGWWSILRPLFFLGLGLRR